MALASVATQCWELFILEPGGLELACEGRREAGF